MIVVISFMIFVVIIMIVVIFGYVVNAEITVIKNNI